MYCVTLWVCRKAAQRFSFSLLSNLEKRFEKKLKKLLTKAKKSDKIYLVDAIATTTKSDKDFKEEP